MNVPSFQGGRELNRIHWFNRDQLRWSSDPMQKRGQIAFYLEANKGF